MTWPIAPIGDVCQVVSGSTPKRGQPEFWGGDIDWVTPKDLTTLAEPVLHAAPERITEAGYRSCSTTMLPKGAVLFSSRAPIGLVAIAGRPMCTNQGFKSLVPGDRLDSGYLYWCMRRMTPKVQAQGTGTTFKEVSKRVLERIEIPVPPLPDQRRIAAILDKADAIRRKRREAIALTEELLQSSFSHIVGAKHPQYLRWTPRRIAALAVQRKGAIRSGPFGSALKHSEFVGEGIAVLGIDNAVQNRFAWGERRFITPEKYEDLRRYKVFPGDVIITIMGTTGRSAVVPEDIPESITTKHLATITVDQTKALPEYVSHALHRDDRVLFQVAMRNRGAIMAGLNLGIIKELVVHLPPLEQQRRWAEHLRAVEATRGRLETAANDADDLFHSLVQRAFRGEL